MLEEVQDDNLVAYRQRLRADLTALFGSREENAPAEATAPSTAEAVPDEAKDPVTVAEAERSGLPAPVALMADNGALAGFRRQLQADLAGMFEPSAGAEEPPTA